MHGEQNFPTLMAKVVVINISQSIKQSIKINQTIKLNFIQQLFAKDDINIVK